MTSSINSTKLSEAKNGLNVEDLIGEVARRHNILISPDDPIFATVTLNELVLARLLERQQEALSASRDQIAATTLQQTEAVKRLGERLVTASAEYLTEQVCKAVHEALKAHEVATRTTNKSQNIYSSKTCIALMSFFIFLNVMNLFL